MLRSVAVFKMPNLLGCWVVATLHVQSREALLFMELCQQLLLLLPPLKASNVEARLQGAWRDGHACG